MPKSMSITDDESLPPADLSGQLAAEQAIEIDRLRRELEQVRKASTVSNEYGVVGGADPNESSAGINEDGEPMFFYRIDLPPSGGEDIRLCGVPFYHGQQYKVDVHQLRTLKEIVARTWAHEHSIRGTNENFYRKETARVLRGGRR